MYALLGWHGFHLSMVLCMTPKGCDINHTLSLIVVLCNKTSIHPSLASLVMGSFAQLSHRRTDEPKDQPDH